MPGVGPKSAQRILNWLLTSDDEVALGIAEAIVDVKKAIHLCPRCHNFAEGELCAICADPSRESETICVVAEPRDVEAIERTGIYQGLYHVLGGVINPMEGSMPEDLHISDLMARLGSEPSKRFWSPRTLMSRARRRPVTWPASSSRSAFA